MQVTPVRRWDMRLIIDESPWPMIDSRIECKRLVVIKSHQAYGYVTGSISMQEVYHIRGARHLLQLMSSCRVDIVCCSWFLLLSRFWCSIFQSVHRSWIMIRTSCNSPQVCLSLQLLFTRCLKVRCKPCLDVNDSATCNAQIGFDNTGTTAAPAISLQPQWPTFTVHSALHADFADSKSEAARG